MPHDRKRYAEDRVKQILKYSSIVGIIGQRQVGKTTLLEKLSNRYVSFDKERILKQARAEPELFLEGHRPVFGIDEAQLCEELFPALKEHVRVNKAKGQFLLSGSVRFTSKESIRESLTGRIISTEVLPFTVRELHGRPLPDLYRRILSAKNEGDLSFLEKAGFSRKDFSSYLATGGLPGISFFREAHIRADKFEAQLDTILNRDIRQIYKTTLLYESLRDLLVYFAAHQGRPFEMNEASRASRISTVTLKRVLFAFEAMFLIRVIGTKGERKPTIFLEDQGMASWLKDSVLETSDDLVRGLYANLRQELHYRPEMNGKIFQWRTKNNVEVPLVLSSKQGILGILPVLESTPSPKTLGSARSFLNAFPSAKIVIAYDRNEIVFKNLSQFWVPYWLLL